MSTVDVVVIPTFSAADVSRPTPPITLRSVDVKGTTLSALRCAIHCDLAAHLSFGDEEVNDCGNAAPKQGEPQQEGADESGTAVDNADLLLLVGGVVLDQPDSTLLADIAGVADAVKTRAPDAKRQPTSNSTVEAVPLPTLTVHVAKRAAPHCITLRINVARSRVPLFVSLPVAATIAVLKRQCATAASMPEHDVVLYPSPGEEPFAEHGRTLLECGFDDATVLYLEPQSQPPPLIAIFIKTLTGVTKQCVLNEHALVDTLKLDLQARMDVSPEQMRLVFAGTLLHDGHYLSEYGVVANATVSMMLRLRGNGHSGIPHSDSSLFFMTFATRPDTTAVKIVDAIGSIPFVQNGVSITLARPCLGALHVWLSSGDSRQKTRFVDGESVQLDDIAEPRTRRERFSPTHRDVALTISHKTIDFRMNLDRCTTAAEVLRTFFSQVAAVLPQPVVEQGFNVYLVRPSGAEVLVDGIEPLLSPHNARKTLAVRKVTKGAQPAVTFSPESDDSDRDAECPPR